MTVAQWIWEYEALMEREKEESKKIIEYAKLFKSMMIGLLGLDLLLDEKDGEDKSGLFIPYALIGGRREIAQMILEKMDKDTQAQKAIEDEEFEKLSSAIAAGDDLGDMEPIMDLSNIDAAIKKQNEADRLIALRRAGVKITDKPIAKNTPHITFDKERVLKKSREATLELYNARKSVEEQLKQEKRTPGLQVLFDEEDV